MITVQKATTAKGVPPPARLRAFAEAALGRRRADITLRVVGSPESRKLNKTWRGKDKATNVLSFPYETSPVQGDVVLCAPVVSREAREQKKPLQSHWAHMVVHGVLHLRGYDHVEEADAKRMEARERAILKQFRIPDPYLIPEARQRTKTR